MGDDLLAYLRASFIKDVGRSVSYILKDEQSFYGILAQEFNGGRLGMEHEVGFIGSATSLLYGIENKRNDELLNKGLSVIMSFDPEDNLTVTEALKISTELMKKRYGKDRAFVVASHINGRNIHCHAVVSVYSLKEKVTPINHYREQAALRNLFSEICEEKGLSNMYELIWKNYNERIFTKEERLLRKGIERDVNFRYADKEYYNHVDQLRFQLRKIIYDRALNGTDAIKQLEDNGYETKRVNKNIYIKNIGAERFTKLSSILPGVNTLNDLTQEIYYQYRFRKTLRDEVSGKTSMNIMGMLKEGSEEEILSLQEMIHAVHEKNFYLNNSFSRIDLPRMRNESLKEYRTRYFLEERSLMKDVYEMEARIVNDLKEQPDLLEKILYNNLEDIDFFFGEILEERRKEQRKEKEEIKKLERPPVKKEERFMQFHEKEKEEERER